MKMNKHNLLFVHIPKNAGSAINSLLIKEGCKYASLYDYKHIPLAVHKKDLGQKIFNSLTKFAVVRNPYDRVVSYYYARTAGKNPNPKTLGKLAVIIRGFDNIEGYLKWVIEEPTDIMNRGLAPQMY